MMNNDIAQLVQEIGSYDFGSANVPEYHHCRFGLPLVAPANRYDVVLMGLAPIEKERDWTLHHGFTGETLAYSWRESVPDLNQEVSNWRTKASRMCGNASVLQSEMFFWSCPDLDGGFRERFGSSFLKSPHLRFCRDVNLRLLDAVQPEAVVVRSLAYHRSLAKLYGLKPVADQSVPRFATLYERDGVPWIFTGSWTKQFVYEHSLGIACAVSDVRRNYQSHRVRQKISQQIEAGREAGQSQVTISF